MEQRKESVNIEVNKKIMYHISSKLSWKDGDKIISGEENNPFWHFCLDFPLKASLNNQEIPILDALPKFSQLDVTEENIKYLSAVLQRSYKEFILYIREQVFEEVRKEYYPILPSRHKCLWVSELNDLEYWETMSPNSERLLLILELTGKVFRADECWLNANTLSSIEFQKRAQKYWAGELGDQPNIEYLFCGEAIVKRAIFFKNNENLSFIINDLKCGG